MGNHFAGQGKSSGGGKRRCVQLSAGKARGMLHAQQTVAGREGVSLLLRSATSAGGRGVFFPPKQSAVGAHTKA